MTSDGIDILRVKLKNKNEVNGGWEQLKGENRAFARTVGTITGQNHKSTYFS